jgi:predicted HAD superfamily phosphohydrolase
LALNGTGTFTLQNAANNVGTIAGGDETTRLGNVAYRDADALEIGSVNPDGIFSTGTVLIETENGDITLSQNINTTSTSTDAIIVNAGRASPAGTLSGGNIIVSSPAPTLTYGSGGIAKLFSGDESASTGLTALAGGSANTRAGFDENSTITPSLAADNAYAIYRVSSGTGDLTIVASGGTSEGTGWAYTNGVITTLSTPVNINASEVVNYLTSGDLRIEAANITVAADVTSATANALTLKAKGNVIVNPSRSITTSGGDVIFWADSDVNNSGYISFGSTGGQDIITNGGDIIMAGGPGTTVPTGYAHGSTVAPGINFPITTNRVILNTSKTDDTAGDIILRGKTSGSFDGIYTQDTQFFGHNLTLDGETGNSEKFGVRLGSSNVYNGSNLSQVIDIDNDLTITAVNTAGSYAGNSLRTGVNPRVYADGNITINSSGKLAYTSNQTFLNINPGKTLAVNFDGTANFTTSLGDPNTGVSQGNLVIQSYTQPSFTSTFNTSTWTFNSNLSGLTLGKAGEASTITLAKTTSITGPITVHGNDITISQSLTATDNDINLYATGAVTQTAPITANGLGLHGTGTFTLTNTANNVVTIAGGDNTTKLGSLRFTDASGGLQIGSVNPDGIYSTGPILIETLDGDITLSQNLQTDDATTDAIVINAGKNTDIGTVTGGDIKVSGSPTVTMGSGGIAKLFSGSESGSTGLTNLVGGESNTRLNVDETTTTFDPVLQVDNVYALYRQAPIPAPSITSFTPTSAGETDEVVITGTDFTGATSVTFGGVEATSFTVDSDTQITAVVAANSDGNDELKVTTPGGTDTATGFTFITPPAAPTSLVATAGDTKVSIAFTAGADGGSTITNYEYSIDNGSNWIAFSPAVTSSPVIITGLDNATEYTIKLRAVNAVGSGAVSESVTSTPVFPALNDLGSVMIVENGGDAEGTGWIYSDATIRASSSSDVMIDVSAILAKLSLSDLTVVGSSITVNAELNYSTGTNGVTLNASGSIVLTQGYGFATSGGDITIKAANIQINSALTATDADITLEATGAVTQTAAIISNGLALKGSGTFTLTNTANNVATIAGGDNTTKLGSLSFTDASGGLEIGSVNPVGITSSGVIEIETLTGNLLVTESVVSTATSGDAIKLYANKSASAGSAGNGDIKFSNNGAITVESGARALLYSGTNTASTGLENEVGVSNIRFDVDAQTDLGTVTPAIASNGKFGLLRFDDSVSDDADLTNLTVSAGSLDPLFSANVFNYNVIVPSGSTNFSFTPTLSDGNAELLIENTAAVSGVAYQTTLTDDFTEFVIEVTSSDETVTKTYRLRVYVDQNEVPESSGDWVNLFYGSNYDPNDDQQATADTDIVGNLDNPMMQGQRKMVSINGSLEKVYFFRVRLANRIRNNGSAPFTSFYYGLDLNNDHKINMVVEANVKASQPYVAYHIHDPRKDGSGPSQTAWLNSSNNQNVERKLISTKSRVTYYATSLTESTNTDLDAPIGGTNTGNDTWLEFAFTESSLTSFTQDAFGTPKTGSDVVGLTAFTSTSQTANGDIAGINDKTADLTKTWPELGNMLLSSLDAVTNETVKDPLSVDVVNSSSRNGDATISGLWNAFDYPNSRIQVEIRNEQNDLIDTFEFDNATQQATGAISINGYSWRVDVSGYDSGVYTVNATMTDNTADPTSAVGTGNFVVSNISVDALVTSDTTPTLTGTTDQGAGVTVTLEVRDSQPTLLGTYTTETAPDGSWSFTIPDVDALPVGDYTVKATMTLGNDQNSSTSFAEAVISVVTAPSLEITSALIWFEGETQLAGTSNQPAGVQVDLELIDSNGVNSTYITTTDADGNWTFDLVSLSVGTYQVYVSLEDVNAIRVSVTSEILQVIDELLITGPGGLAGAASSEVSIPENTTTVFEFEASETVNWTVEGGPDAALLQFNGNELAFISAPDFENPQDADSDNIYQITVRATNSLNAFAEQTVSITVTDIDEVSPVVTVLQPSSLSIVQDATSGEKSVQQTIGDGDTFILTFEADETVEWTITGGVDAQLFTISSDGSLNLNAPVRPGQYEVRIRATDAAQNITEVIVLVTRSKQQLTITAAAGSKVYGQDDPELTYTVVGLLQGDSVTGSATRQQGNQVGEYQINQGTLSTNVADDYEIEFTSATFTIEPKTITVVAKTGITKVYDGTRGLPADETGYEPVSGFEATDDVRLIGKTIFSQANVGQNLDIEQGTLALSGTAAGNYELTWQNGQGSITPATLTVKVQNDAKFITTTDLENYKGVQITGFVGSDDISVVDQSGLVITRSNATVQDPGQYPGVLVAEGLSSNNYEFSYQPGNFTIVPAEELLVELESLNVVYGADPVYTIKRVGYYSSDGDQIINLANTATLNDDALSIEDGFGGSANFTIRPVDPVVSSAGYLVTGGYELEPSGITGSSANFSNQITLIGYLTVDPAIATIAVSEGTQREYDGTREIPDLALLVEDIQSGDTVTASGSGLFDTKGAGTSKPYTVTDIRLSGTDAKNYRLSQDEFQFSDGVVSRATVTLAGSVGVSKTYDGTTAIGIGNTGYETLQGLFAGDVVQVSGSPVYTTALPGTGITIQQGTVALSGPQANNYQLEWTDGSGDITAAMLTVTVNDAAKFVTQSDPNTFNGVSVTGFVGDDTIDVVDQTNLVITRSNSSIQNAGVYTGVLNATGVSAPNYEIAYQPGTFTIVPADQLLIDIDPTTAIYGDDPVFSVTRAAYVSSDNQQSVDLTSLTTIENGVLTLNDGAGGEVTLRLTPNSATYSTSGNIEVGTWQLRPGNQQVVGQNFSNTVTLTGSLTVQKRPIRVEVTDGVQKNYDGLTTMPSIMLGSADVVEGDLLTVNGIGTYDSKDASSSAGYSVSNMSLSGSDATNYSLTDEVLQGTDGVINPITLNVSITGKNRVYNATRSVETTYTDDRLDGDDISVSYSAEVGSPNVGTSIALVISGLQLTGSDASNYQAESSTNTISITVKPVTIRAVAGQSKIENEDDPLAFEYTAEPNLLGEDVFTGSLSREVGEEPGTYAIQLGSLSAGENYSLTFVPVSFLIEEIDYAGIALDKILDYADTDGTSEAPGVEDYERAGATGVTEENLERINEALAEADPEAVSTPEGLQALIDAVLAEIAAEEAAEEAAEQARQESLDKILDYADTDGTSEAPGVEDYERAGATGVTEENLERINEALAEADPEAVSTPEGLQALIDAVLAEIAAEEAAEEAAEQARQESLDKILDYADTDGTSEAPGVEDYERAGATGVTEENLERINEALAEADPEAVSTPEGLQALIDAVLAEIAAEEAAEEAAEQARQESLDKILDYADTDGTSEAPGVEDYERAGATGVTEENLERINEALAEADPEAVSTPEGLQALIDAVLAEIAAEEAAEEAAEQARQESLDKILDYADTDGTSEAPGVEDYERAGATGVTEENLERINEALAEADPEAVSTPEGLQALIDAVLAEIAAEEAAEEAAEQARQESLDKILDYADTDGTSEAPGVEDYERAGATGVTEENLERINEALAEADPEAVSTPEGLQALIDAVLAEIAAEEAAEEAAEQARQESLDKILDYADTDGTSEAPGVEDYERAGATGVTEENLERINEALAEADPEAVSTPEGLQALIDAVLAEIAAEEAAEEAAEQARQESLDKILDYADTDGTSEAPGVEDYERAGATGVTEENLERINEALAEADPEAVSTPEGLQALIDAVLEEIAAEEAAEEAAEQARQESLDKILDYADTDGTSEAPGVEDYERAGATGVTEENLERINEALAEADPEAVSTPEGLQALIDAVLAEIAAEEAAEEAAEQARQESLDKILDYADTDGTSEAPGVEDYERAGATGVTEENLERINEALAEADPEAVSTPEGLQALIDAVLEEISRNVIIVTESLGSWIERRAGYVVQLEASEAVEPLNWSLATTSSPLPSGLTLTENGIVSGTPAESGIFTISVQVTDATGKSTTRDLTLTILPVIPELRFMQSPALSTEAGFPFGSVTVAVYNQVGEPLEWFDQSVTVQVSAGFSSSNSGNAQIFGNTTQVGSNGVYTFDELFMTLAGENFRLVATAQGAVDGLSEPFTITPGPPWSLRMIDISGSRNALPVSKQVATTMNSVMNTAITSNIAATLPTFLSRDLAAVARTMAQNTQTLEGTRLKIEVTIFDEYGNLTFYVEGDTRIDLNTDSDSGAFFLRQTETDPIRTLQIPVNQSKQIIFYEDVKAGEATLQAEPTPPPGGRTLAPAVEQVIIRRPAGLRATPELVQTKVGEMSALRVELISTDGIVVNAPFPGVSVSAESLLPEGKLFFDASAEEPLDELLILPAESGFTLWYLSSQPGTDTVQYIAPVLPAPNASQQIVIEAGSIDLNNSSIRVEDGNVGQPIALKVLLRDAFGNAVTNQATALRAEIVSGVNSGIAYSAMVESNSGEYTSEYIPTRAGIDSVTVYLSGEPFLQSPYLISVLATNPARLELVQGDEQQAVIGETLETALITRVLDDFDNPIIGVTVRYEVITAPSGGTGTLVGNAQASTDSLGYASVKLQLGVKSGQYQVRASVLGLDPVVFSAQANTRPVITDQDDPLYGGPYKLRITASNLRPERGDTIQVAAQLMDNFDNALSYSGLQASWSTSSEFGTIIFGPGASSFVTDSNGQLSIRYYVGEFVGSEHVLSLSTSDVVQPNGNVVNPVVSGASAVVRTVGGSLASFMITGVDTVKVGQISELYRIRLLDATGAPMLANEEISFRLSLEESVGLEFFGSETQTGGQLNALSADRVQIPRGQVDAYFRLTQQRSGVKQLTATQVQGVTQLQGQAKSIVFVAGDITSLNLSRGDSQSGLANRAAEEPLEVVVADNYGNPIQGLNIIWELVEQPLQATGSGFLVNQPTTATTTTSRTDSTGKTQVRFRYGDIAGPYTVMATSQQNPELGFVVFVLEALPDEFAIEGNYPNPFMGQTTIPIQVPVTSQVTIEVFDITGGRVRTLLNGETVEPGRHLIRFDARDLASDVYVIRMIARGADGQSYRGSISVTLINR